MVFRTLSSFAVTKIKPFKSIPGPKSLPLIGTLHHYLITKKYSPDMIHKNGKSMFEEFGPIVKEDIVPGFSIVWLFDPDDIRTMYLSEGDLPCRISHLALEKYRIDRPNIYNNAGLLATNGREWQRMRQAAQGPISFSKALTNFLPDIDKVALDFVNMLRQPDGDYRTLQSEDFLEHLKKYFLEVTGVITLGIRFGAIQRHLDPNSIPRKLLDAAFTTNANIMSTDGGLRLWRFFETRPYKKIRKSQTYIEMFILNHLNEITSSERRSCHALVNQFLDMSELDRKDVITLLSDMLLAGMDTTSYTTGFLLYEVSRNLRVQRKVAEEVERVTASITASDVHLSANLVSNLNYTKMVLKESMRLHPISVGVGRKAAIDNVYSGYWVPAGTYLVSHNQASCISSKYCPDAPDKFVPERWARKNIEKMVEGCESKNNQRLHPYLSLPFGFGPRMCIGRRVAEQSLLILLARMCEVWNLEWKGADTLDCVTNNINIPDSPLLFKITDRGHSLTGA